MADDHEEVDEAADSGLPDVNVLGGELIHHRLDERRKELDELLLRGDLPDHVGHEPDTRVHVDNLLPHVLVLQDDLLEDQKQLHRVRHLDQRPEDLVRLPPNRQKLAVEQVHEHRNNLRRLRLVQLVQCHDLQQQILHLQNHRLLLVHDLCQNVLDQRTDLLGVQIIILQVLLCVRQVHSDVLQAYRLLDQLWFQIYRCPRALRPQRFHHVVRQFWVRCTLYLELSLLVLIRFRVLLRAVHGRWTLHKARLPLLCRNAPR